MKNYGFKEFGVDVLVDLIAGMIIAVGVYNFALSADFPVAGFSGIAIILYHLLGLPVGIGTILLNIPVAIFCYKFLGVLKVGCDHVCPDGLCGAAVSGI